VAEQQVYRVPGSDDRGIGVFARASTSPSDRNLTEMYVDAGVEFIGLDDKRANDKFGIAVSHARVSRDAQALDLHYRRFVDASAPVRSAETLFTAAYQYEIRSGWSLQPNLQYMLRPGGGRPARSGRILDGPRGARRFWDCGPS
jgi:porin